MIELSPTTLNLFLECPRCFWLAMNEKIKRPSGIFPSLPSGMDHLIKKYFDSYRQRGCLPPEIDGQVLGKLLEDQELLRKWRHWKSGLQFEDNELGVTLRGAFDDCLVDGDSYIPVDYKTRGYDLKEDAAEPYRIQMDSYVLLLEKNGYKTPSFGYLIFYIPREVLPDGIVKFSIESMRIDAEPHKAYAVLKQAAATLNNTIPSAHTNCGFCSWANDIVTLKTEKWPD